MRTSKTSLFSKSEAISGISVSKCIRKTLVRILMREKMQEGSPYCTFFKFSIIVPRDVARGGGGVAGASASARLRGAPEDLLPANAEELPYQFFGIHARPRATN